MAVGFFKMKMTPLKMKIAPLKMKMRGVFLSFIDRDKNCIKGGVKSQKRGCEKTTPQKTDRHITESIDGYVPVVV